MEWIAWVTWPVNHNIWAMTDFENIFSYNYCPSYLNIKGNVLISFLVLLFSYVVVTTAEEIENPSMLLLISPFYVHLYVLSHCSFFFCCNLFSDHSLIDAHSLTHGYRGQEWNIKNCFVIIGSLLCGSMKGIIFQLSDHLGMPQKASVCNCFSPWSLQLLLTICWIFIFHNFLSGRNLYILTCVHWKNTMGSQGLCLLSPPASISMTKVEWVSARGPTFSVLSKPGCDDMEMAPFSLCKPNSHAD